MDPLPTCPAVGSGVSGQLYLTLLNALTVAACDVDPTNKYPADYGPQISDFDEFDFIVIGSGSAGAVAAEKLATNPNLTILVLEAGTTPSATSEIPSLGTLLLDTVEDFNYTAEPSPNCCKGIKNQTTPWPRAKMLGGCSGHNSMMYYRGSKQDFDRWGEFAEGWSYESILPYFFEIEKFDHPNNDGYFGTEGLLPLTQYLPDDPLVERLFAAGRELGYPNYTREHNLGFFPMLFNSNGTRQNVAKVFLTQHQENLKVSHNSFVEKLIIDEGKNVSGVLVKIGDRKVTLRAKKEVIVSAGTVNSPQLLLLSGIGPKEHLESVGISPILDLPVGKNVQDHFVFFGFVVKVDDWARTRLDPADELYKYFMHQTGDYSKVNLFTTVGLINTRNDSIYSNNLIFNYLPDKGDSGSISQLAGVYAFRDDITEALVALNQNYTTYFPINTVTHPKSRGEILLRTTNPYDKPIIQPNYLEDPDDLEILLEGIRFLEKIVETDAFQKLNPDIADLGISECSSFEFRSDAYWKCYIQLMATTDYHPVGTCSLGSVVDSRLRVKGINNLRVMDASIMPTIIGGNIQAGTMAVGRKGADIVLEDWGLKTSSY